MRVVVISRPKHQLKPEEMPMLYQGFSAWRERYRDQMESFEFFLGGGGFGIVDVDDPVELNQMLLENPILFVGETEVTPILDGDVALRQWGAAIEQMQAQIAGASA